MKFDYLTDEQLLQMHEASLEMLEITGISTTSERFKKVLLENGCKEDGERILFPKEIVEKHLKTPPKEFKIYGRDEKYVLEMGKGNCYAQTCVGTPSVMDLNTWQKRDCLLEDLENYAKLADALEFIDIVSPIFPRDVPQSAIVTMETVAMLENSSKPIRITAESSHEMKSIIEVLAVAAGGEEQLRQRPLAYIEVSPVSPLSYGLDPAEALVDIVEAGLPLGIIPCPMMGSTGPMTLVGCVTMHNAEILAGVVASQMINPGHSVIMSPRVTFMDMHSGVGLWAMPEMGMAAAASAQLVRHYGIPSTLTGYSGASKICDSQSAYEHLYNALMPALVGTDILAAAGSLDNALTSCYSQLVIDNELSSVIKRTIKGVEVNEENLAVAVTDEIVRKKSNFLMHKHTRNAMRSGELWTPYISERMPFEKWAATGETVEVRAKKKAIELLNTHEVNEVSPEAKKEFKRIVDAMLV